MHAKKIIGILFIAAVLLAVGHYYILELGWYYYYPHVDILMHLLGGFVASLLAYAGVATLSVGASAETSLLLMLLFVLIVAGGWELFELQFSLTEDAGVSLNTASDILFGVVGGLVGWSVVTTIKK